MMMSMIDDSHHRHCSSIGTIIDTRTTYDTQVKSIELENEAGTLISQTIVAKHVVDSKAQRKIPFDLPSCMTYAAVRSPPPSLHPQLLHPQLLHCVHETIGMNVSTK